MKLIKKNDIDGYVISKNITIYNELSGKEWCPPGTLGPGTEGWYEDCPKRVYINTKNWSIVIGFSRKNGWSQGWSPWHGYRGFMGMRWWPIAFHPSIPNRCLNTLGCGRMKNHRGPHR